MQVLLKEINGCALTRMVSDDIIIKELQDASDIMAESYFRGSSKIIIEEKNITPDFFDLKTGLAGEILQKFSTYRVELAIIGDFSKYKSKSLQDFIFESNKYGHINFVNSYEEAEAKLIRK